MDLYLKQEYSELSSIITIYYNVDYNKKIIWNFLIYKSKNGC